MTDVTDVPIPKIAIAGAAALLMVLVFVCLICCCCCRNKQTKKEAVKGQEAGTQAAKLSGSSARPESTGVASKQKLSAGPTSRTGPHQQQSSTMMKPVPEDAVDNSMPPMYGMDMLDGYAFGSGQRIAAQDSVYSIYSLADKRASFSGEGGAELAAIPVMATPEYASDISTMMRS